MAAPGSASWVAGILARDLRALRREVEAYADERDLWRQAPGVVNPGGNLALHCAGNLQHFIGGVLGGSGYVRNRDAEFGQREVPRTDLPPLSPVATAIPARTPVPLLVASTLCWIWAVLLFLVAIALGIPFISMGMYQALILPIIFLMLSAFYVVAGVGIRRRKKWGA